MKCIRFDKEDKYIKDFIDLPKKLYTKKDNMEDSSTIKSLLLEEHPLSKYFKLLIMILSFHFFNFLSYYPMIITS